MDRKAIKRIWLTQLKGKALFCALCGGLIEARKDLNADHHYTPKSKGGASDETNLRPTHKWCNTARADHSLKDWNKHGAEYLAKLATTWKAHRVKFNAIKVANSIRNLIK